MSRLRHSFNKNRIGHWFRTCGHFLWSCTLGRFSAVTLDPDRLGLGPAGELAAARYLRKQGYTILEHSHRQRLGEIDLIAVDGNCVVFVEVKTWRSGEGGDPSEAVNYTKQQKITRTALVYLKQKRLLEQPARFDVVSVVWPREATEPQIRHFKHAFEASGRGQMYQ